MMTERTTKNTLQCEELQKMVVLVSYKEEAGKERDSGRRKE
jgi:hypothetical protein